MPKGLLPHCLNCPWRASATSAMVRSSMSVPMAAIGAVRLLVSIRISLTSLAAMPACTATSEQTDSLCVA